MDGNVSEEYTASVFRAEIILYLLPTKVYHDVKPSKMAHGDASGSYSGGVPGWTLGLDIEFSEGVRVSSQPLQVNAPRVPHIRQWLLPYPLLPIYYTLMILKFYAGLAHSFGDNSAGWKKENSCLWPPAGSRDLSVLWTIATGSGARPASYSVGIRGLFLRRYSGRSREVDLSPPSTAEFKNERSCFSASAVAFIACTGISLPLLITCNSFKSSLNSLV